ncbi:hypothetical protein HY639_02280 [Candidatus Woesearchaeota archaeon]|nr:hypothetical protein [Candidatus Woesearchaeota archaeon]
MVRTLDGRIVVLPSKTPNGDFVPGVIEVHQIRNRNNSPAETRYQPRYSFLPEHLGPDLDELFEAGRLKTPTAVAVTVEDTPGRYNSVVKSGIRKR